MATRKLPKRLFKNKDVIHSYEHDRATQTSAKHMTRDHTDVLQNIEFALVRCAREDPGIDDSVVDQALQISKRGAEPTEDVDPRVAAVCSALAGIRSFRHEIPDAIWVAGLRTVDESVRRHSSLRPGEKSYLTFVEPYVQ
jgi:hypothetical protein